MAIADRERELIKIRTKEALAEKKKQGYQLGTIANLTNEGRTKGAATNKGKAATNPNNKKAMLLISEYIGQGMTLRGIADKLNENGFKTAKGRAFQANTVRRLRDRIIKAKTEKDSSISKAFVVSILNAELATAKANFAKSDNWDKQNEWSYKIDIANQLLNDVNSNGIDILSADNWEFVLSGIIRKQKRTKDKAVVKHLDKCCALIYDAVF